MSHALAIPLFARERLRISTPGEQHRYTFTGSAGQRLYYDGLDTDSVSILAQLVDPTGNPVSLNGNSRYDVGPFTLLDSGTYTLVISGANHTVGNYNFRLLDLIDQFSLPVNAPLNSTLTPGTSADLYQFVGVPGENLYFHGQGSSSQATWTLYGPNNESLAYAGIGGDFQVTLTEPGTYAVVIAGSSASPVNYSVQVGTFDKPITPLVLGTSMSGSIAKPGQQQIYTFSGSVGQQVYFDSLDPQDSLPISIQLLSPASPTGPPIFQVAHGSDDGPFTLTSSGVYQVVVSASGATIGNFNFQLSDTSSATPLTFGAVTSGQLSPSLAANLYQFDGKPGQAINLTHILGNASQATWRLASPADVNLTPPTPINLDLGTVVLPMAGSYLVLVEGQVGAPQPVSYQFRVTDVSEPSTPSTDLGTVLSGTLTAGQQPTSTFTASAGQVVYFNSQDRSSSALLVTLSDPGLNPVFTVGVTADSGPYILAHSGTYTLTVKGSTPSVAGTYKFRLLDLNNGAPVLPLNAEVKATLASAYQTDVYQFSGTTGQRLYYDAFENDFDNVLARLWTPDGTYHYMTGNSDQDVGPFTLQFDGTYYLIIESNFSTPASYDFKLLDTSTAPALPLESPISSNLDPGLSAAIYQLAGTTGQKLYCHGPGATGAGTVTLFDPNNGTVSSANLGGDFQATLAGTGSYLLIVSGNSTSPVSYSFEVYNPNNTITGGPQIVSIANLSGAWALTWSAAAGQSYRVQYKTDLGAMPFRLSPL
jgi:hypothetical protein